MNGIPKLPPAAQSAIAGGVMVGVAAAIIGGAVLGPSNGVPLGFWGSVLFGLCAVPFGVIAGGVAGACDGPGASLETIAKPADHPVVAIPRLPSTEVAAA